MTTPDAPLLRVRDLSAGYGGLTVVHDVCLDVAAGELVCMVGRNGAGKSTTMMAIAGIRNAQPRGSVVLGGAELGRSMTRDVVAVGLSLVPDGHRVFEEMSVLENLRMGAYVLRRSPSVIQEQLRFVYDLFPVLHESRRRPAGQLSGGQQQMVSLGQAIMSRPRVLLLDEPSSGLAPVVVNEIYRAIHVLKSEGIGLLVVEQNVDRALRESDRCYVLESGRVALEGASFVLAGDRRVTDIVTGIAMVRHRDG